MSLAQHKPSNAKIYDFIYKKRAEGKYYLSAYIAGFNKFLRIYYARANELYNTKQVLFTYYYKRLDLSNLFLSCPFLFEKFCYFLINLT